MGRPASPDRLLASLDALRLALTRPEQRNLLDSVYGEAIRYCKSVSDQLEEAERALARCRCRDLKAREERLMATTTMSVKQLTARVERLGKRRDKSKAAFEKDQAAFKAAQDELKAAKLAAKAPATS